jgi:hypothetical protein
MQVHHATSGQCVLLAVLMASLARTILGSLEALIFFSFLFAANLKNKRQLSGKQILVIRVAIAKQQHHMLTFLKRSASFACFIVLTVMRVTNCVSFEFIGSEMNL